MKYSLVKVAEITCGKLHGIDNQVDQLFTDSRNASLHQTASSLFVSLNGSRQKGEAFIDELYAKGFRNFLVDQLPSKYPDANFIVVSNTLAALQAWAAYHRSQFRLPVIGITGSNGKTIVKEWLYQLLHHDFNIIRSPGSYNSQLGVPLSVLRIEKSHTLAIFEAGISLKGEMKNLATIIKPDLVILTHMGSAHDEGFDSFEQKIAEKLQLAQHADCLVYCKDNETVNKCVTEFLTSHYIKTISWSLLGLPASVSVKNLVKSKTETNISFIYKSTLLSYNIPFTDEASIENSLSSICALIAVERLDTDKFNDFYKLIPVAGRLEQKRAINNSLLINDSYSSDLHSLHTALQFMDRQNPSLGKTVILSDILESGLSGDMLYTQINNYLKAHNINKFIGIGPAICSYGHLIDSPSAVSLFQTTDEFIKQFNSRLVQEEIILLKGARVFEFEHIAQLLEKQSHQSVLEINLDAVVHNLNIYKNNLPSSTALMVMVKAFSYGSGSFELAKLLQHHRVDYLAVAYADEGVLLRNSGINIPIMVMNATEASFKLMLDYDLEPVIYSIELLIKLNGRGDMGRKQIGVHLEFETGMNRLGIDATSLDLAIELIKSSEQILVKSAFTHMASADDPNADDFTKKQLDAFKTIHRKLCNAFQKNIPSHAANTAGISRFNGFNFDMARLGLGLHGIDPSGDLQNKLRPVSRLKSVVTQVKRLNRGDGIGYNSMTVVTEPFNMAVVAIGYADGLNRLLSNRKGVVYIQGQSCEIVGNICMDMCMVDIGSMDVQPGEEVIIFETAKQIQQIAATCKTISYEILTGISERITRIYLQE